MLFQRCSGWWDIFYTPGSLGKHGLQHFVDILMWGFSVIHYDNKSFQCAELLIRLHYLKRWQWAKIGRFRIALPCLKCGLLTLSREEWHPVRALKKGGPSQCCVARELALLCIGRYSVGSCQRQRQPSAATICFQLMFKCDSQDDYISIDCWDENLLDTTYTGMNCMDKDTASHGRSDYINVNRAEPLYIGYT